MLKIEEKGVALQAIKISDPVANTTSMTDYFLEVNGVSVYEAITMTAKIVRSLCIQIADDTNIPADVIMGAMNIAIFHSQNFNRDSYKTNHRVRSFR